MSPLLRVNNPDPSHFPTLLQEVQAGRSVVVQFGEPVYDAAYLGLLNALCAEADDKLCIRFYGHYGTRFDCGNLRYLTSVKSLTLDVDAVDNFTALKLLDMPRKLHICVFNLDAVDFLSWKNLHALTSLGLAANKKNNIDLGPLVHFTGLTDLFLGGHTKNLDSVGSLDRLAKLSLNLPASASIEFVNNLRNLASLRFVLGGRQDLSELRILPIEALEIVRVKGLNSLGDLSRFSNLQHFSMEDQLQVSAIAFPPGSTSLLSVNLFNCKGLSSVAGLSNTPSLSELRIGRTAIDFEVFMQQEFPTSLEILAFYTGKKRQDEAIKERLSAIGYSDRIS